MDEHTQKQIGAVICGKYRIVGHLGSGGMCDVYDAEHFIMGKRVAIKVLRPEFAADPTTCERFEREARTASRIHHPNAINMMDLGSAEDGSPFIVMEFVDGKTLEKLIQTEGPLGPQRAANILRQAAGALEAAHTAGIIHRDIKPQNIIVSCVDNVDWVKVVDFGVSKAVAHPDRGASLTAANFIVGTPRYMSPEQCDNGNVDARSDVYSLGVVLYEMLAGSPPFEDDSPTRLLVRHCSERPPALATRCAGVSPEVEYVVMRALEKDPGKRPQGAAKLSRLFDEAVGLGRPDYPAQSDARSRIEVALGDAAATIVRQRTAGASVQLAPAAEHVSAPSMERVRYEKNMSDEVLASRRDRRHFADERREGHSALIAGLVALLVVAVGVAAYLYINGMPTGSEVPDSVSRAQQSVADAIARVDSLPRDHPLRGYLPELEQWQGELRAYVQIRDSSDQVKTTADQYRLKADQLSGQARIAIAALARQANQESTAQPPTESTSATRPTEKSAENSSGPANRELTYGAPVRNANANRPEQEPPSAVPPRPQPSRARPENTNSGF
jgi:tRNA A-37 threonylcarbamoyl transferase component Bud32